MPCYDAARPVSGRRFIVREPQELSFYSPLEEGDRRLRLRRLDDLLDALEQLNLAEQGEIPPTLRDQLIAEGIPVSPRATVTDLIDLVLTGQEQYMLKERRTGRRRRRMAFIPTEQDLVQGIRHRFQR